MSVVAALDYLRQPEKTPFAPFCVIAGDDAYLRRETAQALRRAVLGDGDADYSLTKYDGATATFTDVLRDVSSTSLFGAEQRMAIIEQAEPFMSAFRDKLEDYVDDPSRVCVLVLQLTSFPGNLRLYKKTNEKGLIIDCKQPAREQLVPWLAEQTPKICGVELPRDAADTLVELLGDEIGVIVQEIKKLALIAQNGRITSELVLDNIESQRVRKVWDLVDAALAGNTAEALRQLSKLIESGDAPIMILAQIAATLRKLAAAAQIILESEPGRPPVSPSLALDKAGVNKFFKSKYVDQLNKVGARRAKTLAQNLLNADLDMKGGSRSDPRIILERFIVFISHPQMKPFETLG